MKTLYLVRHAKSDWSSPALKDFDRPLNKRGKKNAPLMGQLLRQKAVLPDVLISSPAVRALTTAQLIAREIGYEPKDIRLEKSIYEASPATLVNLLSHQPDAYGSLMLFGHNPGLTELANLLSDFDEDNIPTTGVVGIQWQIDSWSDIRKGKGQLLFFHYPKQAG